MKVTLRPAVTLDGFIADSKGECYSWVNPDDEDRYNQAVQACGCEIVGRKTYEQYAEDFNGRKGITTFVYTNRTGYENRENVQFVGGDITKVVQRISDSGYKELILSGGGELNGLMANAKLIDEIHLSVHPLYLYEGVPLFGTYTPQLSLKLLSSNHEVPAVTQSIYKVRR